MEVSVEHHFCQGVYAKAIFIPMGKMVIQHIHEYDHLSILGNGKVNVLVEGVLTTYHSGSCITIKAGLRHAITALDDSIWFCIHKAEEQEPALLDASLITKGDKELTQDQVLTELGLITAK